MWVEKVAGGRSLRNYCGKRRNCVVTVWTPRRMQSGVTNVEREMTLLNDGMVQGKRTRLVSFGKGEGVQRVVRERT